ncbi:MAG: precorrin-2 C(20)-methyltransferase [Victivallales bacterium]|nr:precorrin-2 C(20)-methyltransferase [Victivallales bacterium]
MSAGKFFGVGLGPGDPELVTLKALRVLREADVVFTVVSVNGGRGISGRVIDSLDGIEGERRELIFSMSNDWDERMSVIRENAKVILVELEKGRNCVFTTIGDSLTYSTYGYVLKGILAMAPETRVESVPGVNSWSALAAASNTVLVEDKEKLCIVPSHSGAVAEEALEHADTVVFLKTYASRDALARELDDSGRDLLYGANLGLENEFISSKVDEISDREKEYLSMLVARKRRPPETAGIV